MPEVQSAECRSKVQSGNRKVQSTYLSRLHFRDFSLHFALCTLHLALVDRRKVVGGLR